MGFSLQAPHACNSSSWGGQLLLNSKFQASLIYSVRPYLHERGRGKDIPSSPCNSNNWESLIDKAQSQCELHLVVF